MCSYLCVTLLEWKHCFDFPLLQNSGSWYFYMSDSSYGLLDSSLWSEFQSPIITVLLCIKTLSASWCDFYEHHRKRQITETLPPECRTNLIAFSTSKDFKHRWMKPNSHSIASFNKNAISLFYCELSRKVLPSLTRI